MIMRSHVFRPIIPSASRPKVFWKATTDRRVSGPKMPSAARGGMLVYRWRMVYRYSCISRTLSPRLPSRSSVPG